MSDNIAALLAAAAAKRVAPKAPAKPEQPKLDWSPVQPDTLPADLAEAYYAIGKAKSAFEAALTSLLEPPAHLKLIFTYKRGLAVALAPKTDSASGLAALMARINAAEG
jgi:hypothetical protein